MLILDYKKLLIGSLGLTAISAGLSGKKGLEVGLGLGIKAGFMAGVTAGVMGDRKSVV